MFFVFGILCLCTPAIMFIMDHKNDLHTIEDADVDQWLTGMNLEKLNKLNMICKIGMFSITVGIFLYLKTLLHMF